MNNNAEMSPVNAAGNSAQRKKRESLHDTVTRYGFKFDQKKVIGIFVAMAAASFGLAFAFNLTPIFMIPFIVIGLLFVPGLIKNAYKRQFEAQRFQDANNYLEQMLYSFMKDRKVLTALKDTRAVFDNESHMSHLLNKAIHHIETVFDEDADDECVLEALFYVVEPLMSVGLTVDTNTDIDYNCEHQQVGMTLNYNNVRVTNPDEQIYTLVMKNGNNCIQDVRTNVRPNLRNDRGLEWSHNKELIFKAGNEYRKFEILDVDRNALGVERMRWDGELFNAWLFVDEPRPNYLTDQDANGAFLIRNGDNSEVNYTCDYIKVHFTLKAPSTEYCPVVNGDWTNDYDHSQYNMQWDEETQLWHTTILLKQGYYSYEYLLPQSATGNYTPLPSEGNFFQTENRYQALVYYKGIGARTWSLVGYANQ